MQEYCIESRRADDFRQDDSGRGECDDMSLCLLYQVDDIGRFVHLETGSGGFRRLRRAAVPRVAIKRNQSVEAFARGDVTLVVVAELKKMAPCGRRWPAANCA